MTDQHAQAMLEEEQQQEYDLAHNGTGRRPDFKEKGVVGLDTFSGIISRAYLPDLQWPTVQPIYDRILRSDPEISIQRVFMANAAGDQTLRVEIPPEVENPTDDDRRYREFYQQSLEDMNISSFWEKNTSHTPFLGWAWWTIVPGLRKKDWRPPDEHDDWRSQFDDGLTGIRRLAWRDQSSFSKWELTEQTQRMIGMWQQDLFNPEQLLPLNESVHMTFGDPDNPEGLATLEAVYRLERIKFALEVVQGIGFGHAAGHLKLQQTENTGTPSAGDKALIKSMARAVLSAQQSNFALIPFGYEGGIMDVPFAAAGDLIAAIKYYSIMKLALLNMQWIAMSTFSGVGSQAALTDSTSVWVNFFNSMQKGFAQQLDQQIGRYLFEKNHQAFPNLTMRSRIVAPKVQKLVELGALGQFITDLQQAGVPLGEDDLIQIRRKSDFLPETLPDIEEELKPEDEKPSVDDIPDENKPSDQPEGEDGEDDNELIARNGFRFLTAAERHPQVIELQSGLFRTAARYEGELTDIVVGTLQQGTPASAQAQAHSNLLRSGIAFDAYAEGMRAGGSQMPNFDMTEDDIAIIEDWVKGQVGFVNVFATRASEVGRMDDDDPRRVPGVAEVSGRIFLWIDALINLAGLGKLSVLGNPMLTLDGPDGKESCSECQKWKGKRHRRSFWEKRDLLRRNGNENYTCGRWVCQHSFFADSGELVVL